MTYEIIALKKSCLIGSQLNVKSSIPSKLLLESFLIDCLAVKTPLWPVGEIDCSY